MKVALGRWPLPHGEDSYPHSTGQVCSFIAQSGYQSAEGSLVTVADKSVRLTLYAQLLHRFELHKATSWSARERDDEVSQHFPRGDFVKVECLAKYHQKAIVTPLLTESTGVEGSSAPSRLEISFSLLTRSGSVTSWLHPEHMNLSSQHITCTCLRSWVSSNTLSLH